MSAEHDINAVGRILEEIAEDLVEKREAERLRPRREFLEQAQCVGFTENQALFLWDWVKLHPTRFGG